MQCASLILYCHLWPSPLYNILPHYLTNVTIFEKKKLLNTKFVFWFSLQLLSETFLIVMRISEILLKMYIGLHEKYRLFLSDINETWIFRRIFKTYSNIKFHENPSSGSRVIPCGTEGQTDMKIEQCSETSAYKIQRRGNYREESIKLNIFIVYYTSPTCFGAHCAIVREISLSLLQTICLLYGCYSGWVTQHHV
jgi:hypothetical protein